jgi:ribosomal protein S27E
MTRLTLHWHLRNIIEGVPDCEAIPVERDEFGVTKWERPTDYAVTGSGEHAKKNGCVNVFYDKHLASKALNSTDTVAYLDAVAHDPCVPVEWRVDAEELLSHHIMERRLICSEEKRSIMREENAEMRNSFSQAILNKELPKRSMQSGYWNSVSCPNCGEGECLFDVDKTEEPNHCLGCGTRIPLPTYPD